MFSGHYKNVDYGNWLAWFDRYAIQEGLSFSGYHGYQAVCIEINKNKRLLVQP